MGCSVVGLGYTDAFRIVTLVTRCSVPWSVLLYNTAEERLEKYNSLEGSKCTALRCGYDHVLVDLELSGAAIAMGGSPAAS
jgi:hypothetical protein